MDNNKQSKEGKRSFFPSLLDSIKNLKPMSPDGKKELDKDVSTVFDVLGIEPETDMSKIPVRLEDARSQSFDLYANLVTGLDPNEVSEYCDEVEKSIYQYEKIIKNRDKDLVKLAKEVLSLQQKISDSMYSASMETMSGNGDKLLELVAENNRLLEENARLKRLVPDNVDVQEGVFDMSQKEGFDYVFDNPLNLQDYDMIREYNKDDMYEDYPDNKDKKPTPSTPPKQKNRRIKRPTTSEIVLPELSSNTEDTPFDKSFFQDE